MKLRIRKIDLKKDRAALLEFHAQANYASDSPSARRVSYACYRAKWLSTPQPAIFLRALKRSVKDKRTIANVWETQDRRVVAYVWVTFTEVPEYDFTFAEVRDIAVAPRYRRRGIGWTILRSVEDAARKKGANALRSETGAGNIASRGLHEKLGFKRHRILYEKGLR